MTHCIYNITNGERYPESNDDIEGPGVLVGFLGTTWLMVAMIIVHYLAFFDPKLDPFRNVGSGSREPANEPDATFKPNPIDIMLVGFIRRRCRQLRSRWSRKDGQSTTGLSRLQQSMTRCILSFVDLQLIAGLGILISGFISVTNDLPAYHWSILVYLAWLSNISHLSGLTALRGYLHSLLLLVGLVPTAFFNWRGDDIREAPETFSLAEPMSLAKCFFSPGLLKVYREQQEYYEQKARQEGQDIPLTPFFESHAFQVMIISLVLLVLNFSSKFLSMFVRISKGVNWHLRMRVRRLVTRILCKLSQSRQPFPQRLNKRQWRLIIVNPCLAMFLVMRTYIDVFLSTLSEIYWLLISSLWATFSLASLKSSASRVRRSETNSTWTFGQTLPVLMLLGPVIMAVAALFDKGEHASHPEALENRVTMELMDRSAGQVSQPSNQAGVLTLVPAVDELLLNNPESLETGPDSPELIWVRRNDYECNYARSVCLWLCLQISSIGIWIVIMSAMDTTYTARASPLSILRWLWVWAFIGQPAATFALILIHLTGEEFQETREWLSHKPVCHMLAIASYCLGIICCVIPALAVGSELDYGSQTGLPSFILCCATFMVFILAYSVRMFLKAR
ncbi:hypothetical protein BHE90_004945 [Fusarium euwallaceae]|uniref:Uncharacterized protein n=1 Tax=Fusarium euwallaceae TaxID=1147111 RepID=A0A430LXX7_9HYPO|nr:hypothetical protein BHE90_004945 [Fusarium euwallaceae]